MPACFMNAQQTAEYLNMSLTWVYRDAPKLGLISYKFGHGRSSKLQFKFRTYMPGHSSISSDEHWYTGSWTQKRSGPAVRQAARAISSTLTALPIDPGMRCR